MKIGDKLLCHKTCGNSFTIDKEYKIKSMFTHPIYGELLLVNDGNNISHAFGAKKSNEYNLYYGKYFFDANKTRKTKLHKLNEIYNKNDE